MSVLPTDLVAKLYRFGFLISGGEQKATVLLRDLMQREESQISQFRDARQRNIYIVQKMCAGLPTVVESPEEGAVDETPSLGSVPAPLDSVHAAARAFGKLPEKEQTALALLYSGLLGADDIAHFLKISLPELGLLLASARAGLNPEVVPLPLNHADTLPHESQGS